MPHNTVEALRRSNRLVPFIQISNLWDGIVIGFAMLKVNTYPNSLNTIVIPFFSGDE